MIKNMRLGCDEVNIASSEIRAAAPGKIFDIKVDVKKGITGQQRR